MITGYTGVCGNYELLVEESTGPQPVVCGPDHVPVGEPELVDSYTDNYNGGCDSTPPVFQDIDWIDDSGCAHLCGVSGWYFNQDQLYRDHDWFVVVADDFQIDITFHSESYTKVKVSGPDPDCASVSWEFYEIFERDRLSWVERRDRNTQVLRLRTLDHAQASIAWQTRLSTSRGISR